MLTLFHYAFFEVFGEVGADFGSSTFGGDFGDVTLNHDLDDAMRSGIVKETEVPECRIRS